MYNDQADGAINEVAAQQAKQRTQSMLSENSITRDSLLFEYKYALKGFAAKLSPVQVQKLKKDPRIKRVTQAQMFHLATSTTAPTHVETMQPGQSTPWSTSRVNGPFDGTGKKAWVMDSGIDFDHSYLNYDELNSVSYITSEPSDDLLGHGTHVAGIIAAIDNSQGTVGVAEGATVASVKVCDKFEDCPETAVLQGINYVSNNASSSDVVNMSITLEQNPNVDDAVLAAAQNGIRFTIAAGNDASNAGNYSPARVNHANIWTISSYDDKDDYAYDSNYGNPPIEYGAPGVSIKSLSIGIGRCCNIASGTSMAAPHMAGLLLAAPYGTTTDGTVNGDPDSNDDDIVVGSLQLPTPIISASVQSSSPRLDWSAVQDAQSYDVYRKFETGSWGLFANTTSTHYIDNSVNSNNLQTVFSPPYQYVDTYSYKVVAVAGSGATDSQYSSTKYFVTDCTSGPACPQ